MVWVQGRPQRGPQGKFTPPPHSYHTAVNVDEIEVCICFKLFSVHNKKMLILWNIRDILNRYNKKSAIKSSKETVSSLYPPQTKFVFIVYMCLRLLWGNNGSLAIVTSFEGKRLDITHAPMLLILKFLVMFMILVFHGFCKYITTFWCQHMFFIAFMYSLALWEKLTFYTCIYFHKSPLLLSGTPCSVILYETINTK